MVLLAAITLLAPVPAAAMIPHDSLLSSRTCIAFPAEHSAQDFHYLLVCRNDPVNNSDPLGLTGSRILRVEFNPTTGNWDATYEPLEVHESSKAYNSPDLYVSPPLPSFTREETTLLLVAPALGVEGISVVVGGSYAAPLLEPLIYAAGAYSYAHPYVTAALISAGYVQLESVHQGDTPTETGRKGAFAFSMAGLARGEAGPAKNTKLAATEGTAPQLFTYTRAPRFEGPIFRVGAGGRAWTTTHAPGSWAYEWGPRNTALRAWRTGSITPFSDYSEITGTARGAFRPVGPALGPLRAWKNVAGPHFTSSPGNLNLATGEIVPPTFMMRARYVGEAAVSYSTDAAFWGLVGYGLYETVDE